MSATGLEVFDQTLQKINLWLKAIMEDLGPDRQRASTTPCGRCCTACATA